MNDPELGVLESQVAISTYVSSGCSTSVVVGISRQIAEEIGCMNPGSLVAFEPTSNLQFTSNAVLPYISANARTALTKAAQGRIVQVNSGFRSVVQQYLLYRWHQQGRCGIGAAAAPGRSNHQSGRALDISNYASLLSAMKNQGWTRPLPGSDPVHFEYMASPDIRGRDVKAFQRLWNRNNPGDTIGEDGSYGPATEARLRKAPATGFEIGATCAPRRAGAEILMVEGPDRVAPGTRTTYSVTVANHSTRDWPATAKLVATDGQASPMFDAVAWESPSVVGELGSAIGAGAEGIIDISVAAPLVEADTPLFQQFHLIEGSDNYGTITLAFTVAPFGDEDVSAEAADQHDDGAEVSGGCATGGRAGGWAALLMPALMLLRRRRRAA